MVENSRAFACRTCPLWGAFFLAVILTSSADACSRNINELTPKTKEKFIQLRKEAEKDGIRIEVVCAYRSPQEQERLYATGRSQPGRKVTWVKHSKHTERTAFDIAVYHQGKITWEPDRYKSLGLLAKRVGGLTWGGDWKVRDYGHFELKEKGE
jgi:peptidoglycan LD-endopeptidase CwlK